MRQRQGIPGAIAAAVAVGKVTFKEITKDRVLYNIVLCAVILFGIALLASKLMVSHQDRVMLDFGISALVISCAMLATLCGAAMVGREFERRTIFVALSHPISRSQFLVGKYLGLACVLALNWGLLTASLVGLLWFGFRDPSLFANSAFGWAVVLALVEGLVLGALAVLFSTFSTTSLSVIFTLGIYLLGNNASQVWLLASRVRGPAAHYALTAIAAVIPDLEHFNLGTKVAYSLPVEARFGLTGLAYGAAVTIPALLASGLLIRWREG